MENSFGDAHHALDAETYAMIQHVVEQNSRPANKKLRRSGSISSRPNTAPF